VVRLLARTGIWLSGHQNRSERSETKNVSTFRGDGTAILLSFCLSPKSLY
jgi:hypothetical protein